MSRGGQQNGGKRGRFSGWRPPAHQVASIRRGGMISGGQLAAGAMLLGSAAIGYVYQGPPFRLSYKGVGEVLCFFALWPASRRMPSSCSSPGFGYPAFGSNTLSRAGLVRAPRPHHILPSC